MADTETVEEPQKSFREEGKYFCWWLYTLLKHYFATWNFQTDILINNPDFMFNDKLWNDPLGDKKKR